MSSKVHDVISADDHVPGTPRCLAEPSGRKIEVALEGEYATGLGGSWDAGSVSTASEGLTSYVGAAAIIGGSRTYFRGGNL